MVAEVNSEAPFTRYNLLQTGYQTGFTTGWMFVYTIQPVLKPVVKPVVKTVVKPVIKPVLQLVVSCIQPVVKPVVKPVVQPQWGIATTGWMNSGCSFNRLSNRFYNRFDNWLYRVNKHPTGCQAGLTTRLTTGWMFVYTIQPVVNTVVQSVWQPVVSCKWGMRHIQDLILHGLQ